jgi:zinc-ribbon domain
MKCRNCGTEIAEKALICFRCGTATTEPRIAPPPVKPARGPIPVAIAMLVIIAAAVWGLPALPPGETRMAGWAAVVVATIVAVWLLRPTPRHKRR